jgi:hypothetical protein
MNDLYEKSGSAIEKPSLNKNNITDLSNRVVVGVAYLLRPEDIRNQPINN